MSGAANFVCHDIRTAYGKSSRNRTSPFTRQMEFYNLVVYGMLLIHCDDGAVVIC